MKILTSSGTAAAIERGLRRHGPPPDLPPDPGAVKILTVVGNRPQFIKAAAVSGPAAAEHEEVLVHTGQHYDDSLSRVFFAELGLAEPDRQLGIGGGTNTAQTARMLTALEPLLTEVGPDAALVYGDTNSTLAGGLAAAQAQIPVVHVEAGMRSYDRAMPEELNRVADRPSLDAAAVPLARAAAETCATSRSRVRSRWSGDVMVDVALRRQPPARHTRTPCAAHGVHGGRVSAGDRPPRRQRRRPGAPARAGKADRGAAGAGACSRCTRARGRA